MMRFRFLNWLPALLAAAALAAPAPAAAQQELGAALEEALGAPVALYLRAGGVAPPLLEGGTAAELLEAAGEPLGAAWYRRIHIRPADDRPPPPRPRLPSGERLTLGLGNIPADQALEQLARAGNSILELETRPEGRVSLALYDVPLEEALAGIARQADVTWSLSYVLIDRSWPGGPGVILADLRAQSVEARQARTQAPPPPVETPVAADLMNFQDVRQRVEAAVQSVVRAAPAERARAVEAAVTEVGEAREYAASLESWASHPRLQLCQPVWRNFNALYNGLPPDTQRELEPLHRALRELLPG